MTPDGPKPRLETYVTVISSLLLQVLYPLHWLPHFSTLRIWFV
jgi:hypothetical protein